MDANILCTLLAQRIPPEQLYGKRNARIGG